MDQLRKHARIQELTLARFSELGLCLFRLMVTFKNCCKELTGYLYLGKAGLDMVDSSHRSILAFPISLRSLVTEAAD